MAHGITFRQNYSKGFSYLQVLEVQVSVVLVSRLVASMTVRNDGVKHILEDIIALLITSNTSNSHDEGMACVCVYVFGKIMIAYIVSYFLLRF